MGHYFMSVIVNFIIFVSELYKKYICPHSDTVDIMNNKISENLLWNAVWKEDIYLAQKLLDDGANLNLQGKNGYTPLMQAAEMENIQFAKLLLKYGANINEQGYNGATALHIAVDISIDGTIQSDGRQGNEPTNMIIFLLRMGADISITNTESGTPLDLAKVYGSKKIINILTGKNNSEILRNET